MASDFLPTMSLPEVNIPQMTPITFSTPTPHKTDMSLLMQSLRMQEQREERAVEQSKQFDTVAANLKKELNPADYAWIDDRVANAKKDFEEEIARGNYTTAYKKAAAAGGMLARDSEILSRKEANAAWTSQSTEVKQLADSGKISQTTRDWWLANNSYEKSVSTDSSTGRVTYNQNRMPVEDIDWTSTYYHANQLVAEQQGYEIANQEDSPVNELTGRKQTSYDYTTYQIKSFPQLMETMRDLVNPVAVQQAYDVAKWAFETKKANDGNTHYEKQGLTQNGSFVNYDEYLNRKIYESIVLNNAAYTREDLRHISYETFVQQAKKEPNLKSGTGTGTGEPPAPTPDPAKRQQTPGNVQGAGVNKDGKLGEHDFTRTDGNALTDSISDFWKAAPYQSDSSQLNDSTGTVRITQ
jgi:hypothetical protein